MNILVVESPAKSRTLKKFLGPDFEIAASFGHIRDLPKKELGVDVEHNFEPTYRLTPGRFKTVSFLKKSFGKADKVYLATDLDREGEAIAWHIVEATGISSQKTVRIVFNEITKKAVLESLKNPRKIDMNLVNSQQARRILDRLVGYKLSPFLWRKVMKGLSAGRVQSVAVRLIVEREEEIDKFKPQEYWEILADLLTLKDDKFQAKLTHKDGKKLDKLALADEKQTNKIIQDLTKATYEVDKISQEKQQKYPFPPYTTSTLQQDATYKLGMGVKKVMQLAQDLYEAGKITYMRTDSTNLAWVAVNSIRKYIKDELGPEYLPEKPRGYRTKAKGAQEAHEAIRPTYIKNVELKTKNAKYAKFTKDHERLYGLIWSRAVACQMNPAVIDQMLIKIKADKYGLEAQGQKTKFDGFLKIYPIKMTEKELPKVLAGEKLKLEKLLPKQCQTQPPVRFNQASLVKKLEELGIGRPSTYAPIIDTIQRRGYVTFFKRFFQPTPIGRVVTNLLKDHFRQVVDYDFTAHLELDLDEIAQGKKQWQTVMAEFFGPFERNLKQKEKSVAKQEMKAVGEGEECPKCQSKLVVRSGKFGQFLACSGYPKCKYTKNLTYAT